MPRCAERLGDLDCDPLPAPLAPARSRVLAAADPADEAALLAFTDIMVQVHRERVQGTHVDEMSISWPLSWRRTTAPCDRHVDEKRLGWAGVMCDAVDGRDAVAGLALVGNSCRRSAASAVDDCIRPPPAAAEAAHWGLLRLILFGVLGIAPAPRSKSPRTTATWRANGAKSRMGAANARPPRHLDCVC